jgi:hypothetical protein
LKPSHDTLCDSLLEVREPFSFPLVAVIPCWPEEVSHFTDNKGRKNL